MVDTFSTEERVTSEFEQRINALLDRLAFVDNPEKRYNALNIIIIQLLAELRYQESNVPNKKPQKSSKEIEEMYNKVNQIRIKFEDASIDGGYGYYIKDVELGTQIPARSDYLSVGIKWYSTYVYRIIITQLYKIVGHLQTSLKTYGLFDSRARSVLSPYVESLIGISHEEETEEEIKEETKEEYNDEIDDDEMRGDKYSRRRRYT